MFLISIIPYKIHILHYFAATCPDHQFFFFPHWWEYLKLKQDALGKCVPDIDFSQPNTLWLIGLAILDILLRVAGFLAVISITIAGFELVRTEGSTEKATNARQRLINSLIGLAIVVGATALVAFIGNVVHPEAGTGVGVPHTEANQLVINRVLNAVFIIFGALTVLFIVLAGFRMVTSGDNPTKVAESRRQILYAVLGLVVIATADAIVNFALNRFNS